MNTKNALRNCLLLLFSSLPTFALHWEPINPHRYEKMLGVGINVNWVNFAKLRKAYEHAKELNISIPQRFKERGFDTVRIRVKMYPLDEYLPKIGKTYGEYIREVINDSLKAGLIPVVTLVARDFRDHPSEETLRETVQWWKTFAENFKDLPYEVSYDLIIETSGAIRRKSDLLNRFYKEALSAIREVDRGRIVFFTPPNISNPKNLPQLWLPENDPYVMVEWHFFAAGPSKTNKNKKWTTGTPQEKRAILKKIRFAKKWCKKHHRACWVGAWMPTNYNKANTDRYFFDGAPAGGYYDWNTVLEFADFMASSLKRYKIPYAVNADSKYFDYKTYTWYQSVSQLVDIILQK